ncbi:MAG TPA: FHA domain-containing protein [Pyrinomonadaceae bacterium]|nr:FHA domain-containing protein [Pyrinomonadaceae bacterium]HMP64344.1 FHA domain-containing protein [Pyrinomonadaceae bacterium]
MPNVKLKFSDREFYLGSGIVTIGRGPDNSISFEKDDNVSRYHAEIEKKGEEYCIVDLNSSNGTTVNGQPLAGEHYLSDGDVILLGGSAELVFDAGSSSQGSDPPVSSTPAPPVEPSGALEDRSSSEITPVEPAAPGGSGPMMAVAAGAFGLAVLVGVGAGVYYFSSPSSCGATASIISPVPGELIEKPTEVRLDVADEGCLDRVLIMVDDIEVASADIDPYSVTLDPAEFADLADGRDHPLSLVLVDREGNRLAQGDSVPVAFETRAVARKRTERESGGDEEDVETGPVRPAKPTGPTMIEVNEMAKGVLRQFPDGERFVVSNRQFLQEIQRMIPQYAEEGYFERASNYRDAINVAFVREQNLDAPLGYMLAMSRSKFDPAAKGQELGLWRMTEAFATEHKYTGQCGTRTIGDSDQICAASAAAIYLKALVLGVFDGDAIYGAVAFGKTPDQAIAWKETLPKNRADLWNSISTPAEREQLVRLFAAGIVAENPQRFNLNRDKPLSELYRLTL